MNIQRFLFVQAYTVTLLCCLLGTVQQRVIAAERAIFSHINNAENSITGIFPGGVQLANHETQAQFAVSSSSYTGPLDLQGGTLSLQYDMNCQSRSSFVTPGTIVGNGNSLVLPLSHQSTPLLFPRTPHQVFVRGEDTVTSDTKIDAITSGFDSNGDFLLHAVSPTAATAQLRVSRLGYDGSLLQDVAVPIASKVKIMKWSQAAQAAALGLVNGVAIARYDAALSQLNLTYLPGVTKTVPDIAWSADGMRLAVATQRDTGGAQLIVYQADQLGRLVKKDTLALPVGSHGKVYSCAWSPDGTKLVIGMSKLAQKQVGVYTYSDAAGIEHFTDQTLNGHVSTVSFAPDDNSHFFIGVVYGDRDSHLRQYRMDHDASGVTLSLAKEHAVHDSVYNFMWGPTGSFLVTSTARQNKDNPTKLDYYTTLYHFNRADMSCTRFAQYVYDKPFIQFAWAHREQRLLCTDMKKALISYPTSPQWRFDSLNLVLQSPVKVTAPIVAERSFSLYGRQHDFFMSNLYCRAGASCSFYDVTVRANSEYAPTISFEADDVATTPSIDVMHSALLPDTELISRVPLQFRGENKVKGCIKAPLVVTDNTTIQLVGDTTLADTVLINGTVTIDCNDYALDLSTAALTISDDAVLRIKNGSLHGLCSAGGAVVCQGSGRLDLDTVQVYLAEDAFTAGVKLTARATYFSYATEQYLVTKNSFDATELWRWVCNVGSNVSLANSTPSGTTATGVIAVTTPLYTLTDDVRLRSDNKLHITTDTTIKGNGFTLFFPYQQTSVITVAPGVTVRFEDITCAHLNPTQITLGSGSSVVWGDNCTIFFNHTAQLASPWHIDGNVTLFGGGALCAVRAGGQFILQNQAQLTLQGMTLRGVSDDTFMFDTDTVLLLSDTDVYFIENSTLSDGTIQCDGVVGLYGAVTITQHHDMQIVILPHSKLQLNQGIEWRFEGSSVGSRPLITGQGQHATLVCTGSTLRVISGVCRIQRLTFRCYEQVGLHGSSGGLVFGSELYKEDEVTFVPHYNAIVHVYGSVCFCNQQ